MSVLRVVSDDTSLGLVDDVSLNAVSGGGVHVLADGATHEIRTLDNAHGTKLALV